MLGPIAKYVKSGGAGNVPRNSAPYFWRPTPPVRPICGASVPACAAASSAACCSVAEAATSVRLPASAFCTTPSSAGDWNRCHHCRSSDAPAMRRCAASAPVLLVATVPVMVDAVALAALAGASSFKVSAVKRSSVGPTGRWKSGPTAQPTSPTAPTRTIDRAVARRSVNVERSIVIRAPPVRRSSMRRRGATAPPGEPHRS